MKAFHFCFIICSPFIIGCNGSVEKRHQETVDSKHQALKAEQISHDTITIAAVGDIMLGTSFPGSNTLPPDQAKNSFKAVLKDLRNADITFGNLEGTLLDQGHAVTYKKNKAVAYYFRMPTVYAGVLKDAGFDVLSLANNHIGDFGAQGRASTMAVLDSIGIHYAGLRAHPAVIFKSAGVTYGFCAFAPNANTVPIMDLKNAAAMISALKKKVDIVIVSFHGGGEGPAFEHLPFKCESYMGEKRGDVHAFAHNAIDAGADVILGNGPHVTRALEKYNNRLIAYSLGNFCTYKCVSVAGACGIAPLLKIRLNRKGEFLSGRIVPLKQTHLNGLERDSTNKVIERIKTLTETDFPHAGLSIADNGEMSSVQN